MIETGGPIPVEAIRKWKLEATLRLLGDTIGISDAQWREPSLLPGWTRGHVATHLARNADNLRAWTASLLAGEAGTEYASPEDRVADIEWGSDRSGLELQIDLDTSAGALKSAWDKITDWQMQIHLFNRTWPLSVLPLVRLHEVALHHIDLDCGFTADAVDPAAARWLLNWGLTKLEGRQSLPKLRIISDSGLTATIGDRGVERIIRGSDARLWAWLAGRGAPDTVTGAAVSLPMLA